MAENNKKRDQGVSPVERILMEAQAGTSNEVISREDPEVLESMAPSSQKVLDQEADRLLNEAGASDSIKRKVKQDAQNVDKIADAAIKVQKSQESEEAEKPSLSDQFLSALAYVLPQAGATAVGGLLGGTEGAAAGYDAGVAAQRNMQQDLQRQRQAQQRDRQLDIQEDRLQDPVRLAQLELQQRRVDQADQNIELREKQLELLGQGESRRGSEQKFQWANRAVSNFESLKPVKTARETISATKNAGKLIEEGLENPVAAAALPTQLARLAGQSGVLTDRDVDIYGTPGSIANKLEQIAQRMATGTLTEQNAQFMRGLAETMQDNAVNILSDEADRVGGQFEQVVGVPRLDVQKYLMSGEGNISQGKLESLPGPLNGEEPDSLEQPQADLPLETAGQPPEVVPAPYGELVKRNGKVYKWNPTKGKYQLAR